MAFIAPTDRPKLVRNRCVIEVFGGDCVLSRSFLDFSVGVGTFVVGLSQICSPFLLVLVLYRSSFSFVTLDVLLQELLPFAKNLVFRTLKVKECLNRSFEILKNFNEFFMLYLRWRRGGMHIELMHFYVWEHIVILYFRTATWMFTIKSNQIK